MNVLLQALVRLFMGLLGLAFLAGLLLALGVYVLFASVRWLLTGRKPQVVMVWQQFSQMRQGAGMRWSAGMGGEPFGSAAPGSNDDVVDVEVREVREDAPRLPDDKA
jgi:hypothetical protein